jgi:hypothetical protein
MAMSLPIDCIELDTSIQCRATIDTAVVNDYADRMTAGDTFPPIDVYGEKRRCWIGDGWHRVLAARQIGDEDIHASLHTGGRADALKHALGANALHGHRRSNADKRRCVEIAMREFPKLSDVAIGKLCGVADTTVATHRPAARVGNTEPETRTGQDGKQYPARRKTSTPAENSARTHQPTATTSPNAGARAPRPTSHFDQAIGEAREWMRRWSHLSALAPICDAITAVLEQVNDGN